MMRSDWIRWRCDALGYELHDDCHNRIVSTTATASCSGFSSSNRTPQSSSQIDPDRGADHARSGEHRRGSAHDSSTIASRSARSSASGTKRATALSRRSSWPASAVVAAGLINRSGRRRAPSALTADLPRHCGCRSPRQWSVGPSSWRHLSAWQGSHRRHGRYRHRLACG
jgi:hypothetical protein